MNMEWKAAAGRRVRYTHTAAPTDSHKDVLTSRACPPIVGGRGYRTAMVRIYNLFGRDSADGHDFPRAWFGGKIRSDDDDQSCL